MNSLHFETMLPILKQYESRTDVSKTILSAKGLKWCVKLGTMSSKLFPFKLYWISITPFSQYSYSWEEIWIMNWVITYPRNSSLSSLSGELIILLKLDLLHRAVNELSRGQNASSHSFNVHYDISNKNWAN